MAAHVVLRSCASHSLEVDENGARDVAAQVLLTAYTVEEVPAEVDHPDIRIAEVLLKPFDADEWTEAHAFTTRVS
jgi:hypothetical protein